MRTQFIKTALSLAALAGVLGSATWVSQHQRPAAGAESGGWGTPAARPLRLATPSGPPEARLDPSEFAKPPSKIEDGGRVWTPCETSLHQANGVVLPLAGARERRLMGVVGSEAQSYVDGQTCIWRIGEVRAPDGRFTAYLRRLTYDPGSPVQVRLDFIKGGDTYWGEYEVGPGISFRIDDGRLAATTEGGAAPTTLPMTANGPPHRADIGGFRTEFAYAVESVAYAVALAEPMGSARRGSGCERLETLPSGVRLQLSDDRMRRLLRAGGYGPGLLDGASCIWSAGAVTGEDGRTYELYLHQLEWGADIAHASERLILMRRGRLVGTYTTHQWNLAVRGADIVFDDARDDGKVLHIGADGPPAEATIDGERVVLERGR